MIFHGLIIVALSGLLVLTLGKILDVRRITALRRELAETRGYIQVREEAHKKEYGQLFRAINDEGVEVVKRVTDKVLLARREGQ